MNDKTGWNRDTEGGLKPQGTGDCISGAEDISFDVVKNDVIGGL